MQIQAGRTTEDPRLTDLDLAAALSTVRVTIVDPDERPMAGVTVWVKNEA